MRTARLNDGVSCATHPGSIEMRRRVTVVAILALVAAACNTPVASPTASPAAEPRVSPVAGGPSPTAEPTPAVVGHWEDAGTMRLGRYAPHAVPLGDGGALVVGNDTGDCLRDNSVITETWLPEAWWSSYVDMPEPRADFAAVTLADGRVLVTAGVDRGRTRQLYRLAETTPERPPDAGHRSLASTWIYDAYTDTEQAHWSQAASLGTARTAPSAALLPDGRVLVAGGYYLGSSSTDAAVEPGGGSPAILAAYRSTSGAGPSPRTPVLDNDGPSPSMVAAMATAEVYDPATDTWSATGPLRYARYDAPAVTLADGRVLVVGSAGSSDGAPLWNFSAVIVADESPDTAELYDPATGRFSLAGALPPVDWAPLEGLPYTDLYRFMTSPGTLLALPDGGALLVGRAFDWSAEGAGGTLVRTLRYDATIGQWSEIDRTVEVGWSDGGAEPGVVVRGHVHLGAVAGVLGDGRILVAGGQHVVRPDDLVALDVAELFDPATGTWTALPPMPQHRAGGAAVLLGDGSLLLVGGYYETNRSWDCAEGPTGLVSTIRFVPGS